MTQTAYAKSFSRHDGSHGVVAQAYARAIERGVSASYRRHAGYYGASRYAAAWSGGRLQCVPFARENSGIELTGNAVTWWGNAAGVYERGSRPEVGSVLNFRATGRMRLGHVAVVSKVLDGRTVEIDHANWGGPAANRAGITRNVTVMDVSEANDWSAVRVSLGFSGEFGSVYPTYGFIYDRPDRGTMVANASADAGIVRGPAPILNAAPSDLRPAAERVLISLNPTQDEEVAEAGDEPVRHLRPAHALNVAAWRTSKQPAALRASASRTRPSAVSASARANQAAAQATTRRKPRT